MRISERNLCWPWKRGATSVSLVLWLGLLVGCQSYGPATVPGDAFDYSAAIARSRSDQMLMNIVRARYVQVPNFLTVSSVIAGYTYQGGAGIQAQGALGNFDEEFVQGSANLGYIERPTITYSPLQGEAFSRRMMRNIPIDVLFALGQAGWPPDVLFRIAVDRVGNAQNMAFTAAEVAVNAEEQVANLTIYDRVINLVTEMQWAGDLEVVEKVTDGSEILRFSPEMSEENAGKVLEFKELVGLDPDRQEFRVTDSTTQLGADDVLVQSRSLLAMINFLSLGVEVPDADAVAGRVIVTPAFVQEAFKERGPIRILSSVERPSDPYAAIRYRGHWFYIEAGDHMSKRTFNAMQLLFELLAPGDTGAAPLLSLPTG